MVTQDQNVPNEENQAPNPPSLFKLYSLADGLDVILMILGSVGAVLSGIGMPVYFHFLIVVLDIFGGARKENTHKTTDHFALGLVGLGLITWISAWAEVTCWSYTGERQALKIRSKYLEAILKQDIEHFDMNLQTGEMIESICNSTELIQNAISEKMGNLIHFLATFIGGMIIGFIQLWQMALVTLAIVPLLAAGAAAHTVMITNVSSSRDKANGQASAIAEQAIAQVRIVYSFVAETKAIRAYSTAISHAQKMGYKAGFINGLGIGGIFIVTYGSFSLLVWFGSILVLKGTTRGSVALTTMFIIIIGGLALGQAALSFSAFGQARAAAQKIFAMIDKMNNNMKLTLNGKEIPKLKGDIELQDVDFFYPSRPDAPVFRKFSLKIPQGKNVALVGSSGSGKSTIIALIERFYDPVAGRILLDGYDIKSLQLLWLRLQLGLVSQEPALFATTIKENIMLGRKDATMEEVESAAKFSNAHTFITKFPDGYDTLVGEKGAQLSGGQKQCIAIARAMLKNPSILLLDEATSALDSLSEKLVHNALDRFMVARTTVIVAHRLSTIQHVNTIAVLEKGRLIEIGTHDELMLKGDNGAYCKLVKLQETSLSGNGMHRPNQRKTPWSSPQITPASDPTRRLSSPYMSPGFSMLSFSSEYHSTFLDLEDKNEQIPEEAKEKDETSTANFWRVLKLNAPEWPQALLGSLGCMLTGVVNPFTALLLANAQALYYKHDLHYVRMQIPLYALYFMLVAAVGMIGYILQQYFWGYVSENLTKRIRERMFAAILENEIAWFDNDENGSSQLSARLAADANTVRATLGDRVSLILQNITLLVVSCVISFTLSWRMSLVCLVVFPLACFSALCEKAFLHGYLGDLERTHRKASTIAGEAIGNIRTVAAFSAEEKVLSLFNRTMESTKQWRLRKAIVSGFTFGIGRFFQFATYATALWYGVFLVSHNEEKGEDMVRVFFVLFVCAMVIGEAISLVPDLLKGGHALTSVMEILDRETQIEPDDENQPKVENVRGDIELRDVDFSYPRRPDVMIFRSFNLRVKAGRSVALVGPSGCGKSTVVALIERFYDPLAGRVMLDGIDIRVHNLKSLRRHIGLVQQEAALFATTIYENIVYGTEAEVSEEEVVEAAKAANAHDFISSLPDGYRTFVGERGTQLSGGQKQRVAIARAVLKNPAILLLDEATSALDVEAERIVQEALDRLMKRRSAVVIAHRLSTVRNVSSIAVIRDGVVIEKGTHAALLANPASAFARLVALQNQHESL